MSAPLPAASLFLIPVAVYRTAICTQEQCLAEEQQRERERERVKESESQPSLFPFCLLPRLLPHSVLPPSFSPHHADYVPAALQPLVSAVTSTQGTIGLAAAVIIAQVQTERDTPPRRRCIPVLAARRAAQCCIPVSLPPAPPLFANGKGRKGRLKSDSGKAAMQHPGTVPRPHLVLMRVTGALCFTSATIASQQFNPRRR